ncbi:Protein kinase domain - like 10 [Theobroma cacao]|nr:Protein kinase domain - like 10 [Theobroma cacao]
MNEADKAPKELKFSQRLNITVDVACALQYLHHHCETSIVHCDLKLSNILLDDKMIGHVGDFGLTNIMSTDLQSYSTSLSSSLKGTIGYVAPVMCTAMASFSWRCLQGRGQLMKCVKRI